jgi:hypothetical protein
MGVAAIAVAGIAATARHDNSTDANKRRQAREFEVAESIPQGDYATARGIAILRLRGG